MRATSNHRNGCSPRAEVDFISWGRSEITGAPIARDSVAKLAVIVPSPTLQIAVVKDGAGVRATSRNCNGRSTRTEVNRCG